MEGYDSKKYPTSFFGKIKRAFSPKKFYIVNDTDEILLCVISSSCVRKFGRLLKRMPNVIVYIPPRTVLKYRFRDTDYLFLYKESLNKKYIFQNICSLLPLKQGGTFYVSNPEIIGEFLYEEILLLVNSRTPMNKILT